jgi:two-component system sensor histidine kinase/response regulator
LAERWRYEHAVELIAQAEQLAFQNDVLQSTAVEMDAPREAAAVTDPGKLTQVLINLIGNAIKFTPRGGEVRVRVVGDADDSRVASIGVSDTGIGIARDRLHAIFEAFEQADEETSRRYGGTGLGLAISQQLCTLMGHQLAVESEVGSGSRFTVLLSAKRLEHAA